MLAAYCTGHDRTVLLTLNRIEQVTNGPAGITVHWLCWCGTRGQLTTGAHTESHAAAHADSHTDDDAPPQDRGQRRSSKKRVNSSAHSPARTPLTTST